MLALHSEQCRLPIDDLRRTSGDIDVSTQTAVKYLENKISVSVEIETSEDVFRGIILEMLSQ